MSHGRPDWSDYWRAAIRNPPRVSHTPQASSLRERAAAAADRGNGLQHGATSGASIGRGEAAMRKRARTATATATRKDIAAHTDEVAEDG